MGPMVGASLNEGSLAAYYVWNTFYHITVTIVIYIIAAYFAVAVC